MGWVLEDSQDCACALSVPPLATLGAVAPKEPVSQQHLHAMDRSRGFMLLSLSLHPDLHADTPLKHTPRIASLPSSISADCLALLPNSPIFSSSKWVKSAHCHRRLS